MNPIVESLMTTLVFFAFMFVCLILLGLAMRCEAALGEVAAKRRCRIRCFRRGPEDWQAARTGIASTTSEARLRDRRSMCFDDPAIRKSDISRNDWCRDYGMSMLGRDDAAATALVALGSTRVDV